MAQKSKTKTDKEKAFEEALAVVNKMVKTENGDAVVSKFGDNPRKVETISSGSLVLDELLGGGLGKGRIIEIYGPESSGKSSLALTAVGNVQKEGGTAVYIDLENALDPSYAEKLGVNVAELAISQPDSAEQALNTLDYLADTGAVDIIVVDSVAALVPQVELSGGMGDQTIGVTARLMAKGLKKVIKKANDNKCTIIFINQLRDKIGVLYGSPETTTGGKALKYYSSQRIDIRRREQIKEGKKVVANKVKLKIVKNKIAPPFREGETVLTFDKGINKAAELIEIGPNPDYNLISILGRTYTEVETGQKIATSKGDAITAIENDEKLFNRLSTRLAKILSGEINVKDQEETEDLGNDNLDEEVLEDEE